MDRRKESIRLLKSRIKRYKKLIESAEKEIEVLSKIEFNNIKNLKGVLKVDNDEKIITVSKDYSDEVLYYQRYGWVIQYAIF